MTTSRSDCVFAAVDGRGVYLLRVVAGEHDEIAHLTIASARALLDDLAVAIARAEAAPLDPAEVLREVLGG